MEETAVHMETVATLISDYRRVGGYLIDRNDLSQILTPEGLVAKFYYKLPAKVKLIGGKQDWRALIRKSDGKYVVVRGSFKSKKKGKEYLNKWKFFYTFGKHHGHLISHNDLVRCTIEWLELKRAAESK